jgi:hypothetical protein
MVNKLFLSLAGTASLDFRDNGKITAVSVSWSGGGSGGWELSFNSSSQISTNDATGTILNGTIPSAAASNGFASLLMNETVDAGERVFLHLTGVGAAATATIITDSATVKASPRRR